MIILAIDAYNVIRKHGTYVVRGGDTALCPCCSSLMTVHGTCRRIVRSFEGRAQLQLRVMKCKKCGRTHRELPHFLIPYKRYSLHSIYEILTMPKENCPCELSTLYRLKHWWESTQGNITAYDYVHIPQNKPTSIFGLSPTEYAHKLKAHHMIDQSS